MSDNAKSAPRAWMPEEDEILKRHYLENTRAEIAEMLGRTKASVRKRCSVLGLNQKHPAVTPEELDLIRQWYMSPEHTTRGDFNLDILAKQLGRTKQYIARLAGKMGLTIQNRPLGDEWAQKLLASSTDYYMKNGRIRRDMWKNRPHPRGMLGKKHSDKFKREQSERVKARIVTPEQTAARIAKQIATKVAKYGSGNPHWLQASNPYSRTRSGKRADLGNQFFRSSWEANYARYLNWRLEQGEIAAWEFEARTFVFEGAQRGVISYTPDFKVVCQDGSCEWHEVKGWLDEKSKERLRKMAEYYPAEKLVLIDRKAYQRLERQMRTLPHWEGR